MMRMLLMVLLVTPLAAVRAQHVAAAPGRPPMMVVADRRPSVRLSWDERSVITVARDAGAISMRRRSLTGGIVGALAGGAIGGVVGCLANRDDYGVFCGGQSDTKVFVGVAVGAALGAIIGSRLL